MTTLIIIFIFFSFISRTLEKKEVAENVHVNSRWTMIGKIFVFFAMSLGVAMVTFIIASILADGLNGGLVLPTFIIGLVFWIWKTLDIFKEESPKKSTQPPSLPPRVQVQKLDILEEIKYGDIGDKSGVILTFQDSSKIRIVLKNLAKIAHALIQDFHKNQFSPGELAPHFLYLRDAYRSTLPPGEYSQLMDILGRFSREGGTVELV